jgi:hypothetical protein
MSTRIINVLIGTWLFISAFMWAHAPLEAAFTMACGGLSVVFSLATIYYRSFRYLNAGLAVLLFSSTIVLSGWRGPTTWHNAVIAIAIFVLALFDGTTESVHHEHGSASVHRERELYSGT